MRRLLHAADKAEKSPADAVALACEKIAGIDVHPVAVIFARATYLLALMPTLTRGRPSTFGVPVYLGDALQWNAREFMNQRDIEIVVPAGKESLSTLPDEDDEKRIILRFPIAIAAQPGLFDAALEQMLSLAEREQPVGTVIAWLKRNSVTNESDLRILEDSYKAFQRLQREHRNHIWGYVARNLSRPIWLASDKQKADVVIGNPPWLAYRAMNKATQKRFMEEMKGNGIWGGLSSVSAYDLSAYFFVRAMQLYMRAAAKIAFVMPYAAMTRKPFALFRKGAIKAHGRGDDYIRFTDAWAFRSDVKPLTWGASSQAHCFRHCACSFGVWIRSVSPTWGASSQAHCFRHCACSSGVWIRSVSPSLPCSPDDRITSHPVELVGSDHNPSYSRASGSGWRDHPFSRRVSARGLIRGRRPPGSGEAVAFGFAGMGLSH